MDYVKYIREKVGHSEIILNYAGCTQNISTNIFYRRQKKCVQVI